jgi:hypothetical protein
MTVTIKDIEDAYLEGDTAFEIWFSEWQTQFYKPMALQFASAMLQALPPEAQAQVRAVDPEKFDLLMKQLGGV